MTRRQEKVASRVKHLVATELLEVLGPGATPVTVTAVDLSPDLKQGTVWVSILGNNPEEVLMEIEASRGRLQRAVAAQLTSKFSPKLTFSLDTSVAYADRIERLIKGL